MKYTANEERYTESEYRRCGNSGLMLPAVSLGLWHNFGERADTRVMEKMCFTAFDGGITHFDIANNYGPPGGYAELNFGRIMRDHLSPYRDELIISTKAGYRMWPGPYGDFGSRKYLTASIDASLKRLGLDYVDIFYHHRPDPDTPIEETVCALNDIVKQGKALYIGLSNYNGDEMERAARLLDELHCPFVINQNRYSILDRTPEKNGLLDAAIETGKGVIAFSPLAQGLLTDRYIGGIPTDSRIRIDGRFLKENSLSPEVMDKISRLNELAKSRGQSLAQMALSWVYSRKGITSVLIGASKPEQILDNIKMAGRCNFTDEELAAIDDIAM